MFVVLCSVYMCHTLKIAKACHNGVKYSFACVSVLSYSMVESTSMRVQFCFLFANTYKPLRDAHSCGPYITIHYGVVMCLQTQGSCMWFEFVPHPSVKSASVQLL